MKSKTFILILLVISAVLLTGCTVTTGSSSRAIRVANEQCDSLESKFHRLQEELKLAEKRADLERQRREFAEERVKKLQEKTGEAEANDEPDAEESKPVRGS